MQGVNALCAGHAPPLLLSGRCHDAQGRQRPTNEGERIAKAIARAGLASRREAEAWIAAGRVAVNGAKIASPALNVTPDDRVTVDGQPLPVRERTRLFLFHKPRGLVTTHADPQGRPTVFAALPKHLPRLISVGRLDANTEGLLLLTNDGGLARLLELPATGWTRRYRVRANGKITQLRLDRAAPRHRTSTASRYGPIEARLDREQGANVWLTFAMREGKNREVKNVLGHLGLAVNRLIRVSFGPFQLGDLPEGAVEEVRTRHLREQLGERVAAAAGLDFAGPRRTRPVNPRSGPGRAARQIARGPPRPTALAPILPQSARTGHLREPRKGAPPRDEQGISRQKAAPSRSRPSRRAGKSAARAQARPPPVPRQAALMRIVGGQHRGRALVAPRTPTIRPTSDRLRESLFNILVHAYGDPVTGARVLDLFAGTGALALEAMSRGAAFALFVDDGAEARALIRENVATLGLGGVTRIFRRDATKLGAAHPLEPFSLVFLDPPYGRGLAEQALASRARRRLVRADALIVVEESGRCRDSPRPTVSRKSSAGATTIRNSFSCALRHNPLLTIIRQQRAASHRRADHATICPDNLWSARSVVHGGRMGAQANGSGNIRHGTAC